MNSGIHVIDGVVILSLHSDDLSEARYAFKLTDLVTSHGTTRAVVDLSRIEFLTSADFHKLEVLAEMFRLNGIKTIFTNLDTSLIAVLSHSIEDTNLVFTSNIDKAVYVINHT